MPKQLDNNQVNEISGGVMPTPEGGCIPQPGWPYLNPFPFPDPLPPAPYEDYLASSARTVFATAASGAHLAFRPQFALQNPQHKQLKRKYHDKRESSDEG
ncbi:MAG: hypothetical protein IPP88_15920 [Betaproteobacteria bacterium]|nr:hypothetical protein [Betaproteobacteria bacterium]